MQPELLPVPQQDQTEEALKTRIERLYRIYGQDWRPFFEQQDEQLNSEEDPTPVPWWMMRRMRQLGGGESVQR